jgi:ankyrin repeat protein
MPRKRTAKPVTTLVLHRSPELARLLEAAKTCSLEPVRRFLAAGGLPDTMVEVEYVDGTSTLAPLIFRAIAVHHSAQGPALHHSLELLLQAGANADAICTDADGREQIALMAACRVPCCIAPVRHLLAHGADPALQTSTGQAALHSAARAGRLECCKLLLGADGCEPDVRECTGETPLVCAVRGGHVTVVELLHKQWGVDLNIKVNCGATLLHVAADSGSQAVLEYVLHAGLDVDAATHIGDRPVFLAANNGHTEAVQTLLDHGASTVDSSGRSVLMAAADGGHLDVIELLLSSGSINVNAASIDGHTALNITARKDYIRVAALLLQHGAAVNAPNSRGHTPLALAATYASAEFVQLLLDAGADLIADVSVLHHAAGNREHSEVLNLLLKQSSTAAMPNTVALGCHCCGPRTAVMMCDQPAHLKLLLAAGADVHKPTDRGNTALHVAAAHKFAAPVLCLLIKAGVDLHAKNNDGKTAAQVATDSGNTLAAALLTRAARDA